MKHNTAHKTLSVLYLILFLLTFIFSLLLLGNSFDYNSQSAKEAYAATKLIMLMSSFIIILTGITVINYLTRSQPSLKYHRKSFTQPVLACVACILLVGIVNIFAVNQLNNVTQNVWIIYAALLVRSSMAPLGLLSYWHFLCSRNNT